MPARSTAAATAAATTCGGMPPEAGDLWCALCDDRRLAACGGEGERGAGAGEAGGGGGEVVAGEGARLEDMVVRIRRFQTGERSS